MAPKKKAAKKKAAKKPAGKTTSKSQAKKTKTASKAKAAPSKAVVAKPVAKSRKLAKPKSATGSLTQSEFIASLQEFCGIEKRSEAKEIVTDISELVTEALKKGYKIPLFGLGKITVRKTKKRKGRNPATGEEITIPARKKVRFTPAKALKEAVL